MAEARHSNRPRRWRRAKVVGTAIGAVAVGLVAAAHLPPVQSRVARWLAGRLGPGIHAHIGVFSYNLLRE